MKRRELLLGTVASIVMLKIPYVGGVATAKIADDNWRIEYLENGDYFETRMEDGQRWTRYRRNGLTVDWAPAALDDIGPRLFWGRSISI
jgi:hypothetical protein